jgi:hypothetical protein
MPRSLSLPAALIAAMTVAPSAGWAAEHASSLLCADVVTSEVTLNRDLTGCSGDGLTIGAPHVRINLNHHRILGIEAADTAAIRDDGLGDLDVFGGAA